MGFIVKYCSSCLPSLIQSASAFDLSCCSSLLLGVSASHLLYSRPFTLRLELPIPVHTVPGTYHPRSHCGWNFPSIHTALELPVPALPLPRTLFSLQCASAATPLISQPTAVLSRGDNYRDRKSRRSLRPNNCSAVPGMVSSPTNYKPGSPSDIDYKLDFENGAGRKTGWPLQRPWLESVDKEPSALPAGSQSLRLHPPAKDIPASDAPAPVEGLAERRDHHGCKQRTSAFGTGDAD